MTEKGAAKLGAYLGVYFSRSKQNPTEVPELHSLPLPPRVRPNRERAKPAKPAAKSSALAKRTERCVVQGVPWSSGASRRAEMQVDMQGAATPTKRQRCVAARSTPPPRSADADAVVKEELTTQVGDLRLHLSKNNATGYVDVSRVGNRFQARRWIGGDGRSIALSLGCFSTAVEAATEVARFRMRTDARSFTPPVRSMGHSCPPHAHSRSNARAAEVAAAEEETEEAEEAVEVEAEEVEAEEDELELEVEVEVEEEEEDDDELLLLLKGPAHSEEEEEEGGQERARTPPPRAEAPPVASAKAARNAKSKTAKPVGRRYGSSNKGRKDGQWYQSKYELEPGVSMVCLAAIDKETGHAVRGVLPSPATAAAHGEIGGGHSPSCPPSPQFTTRNHR